MQQEFASNGVRYKWDLAGANGASFIVFKENHSDEEIKSAIAEIRNRHDVVCLRQASRWDLLDDYWSKVYVYAEDMYFLSWTQIQKDVPELFNAIRTGKTPQEYVDSKWKSWKNGTFKISQ